MIPGGVNRAPMGSCAVDCPACPRDLPSMDDEPNPWSWDVTQRIGDPEGEDDDNEDDDMPELEYVVSRVPVKKN